MGRAYYALQSASTAGELLDALPVVNRDAPLKIEQDGEFWDVCISIEDGCLVFSAVGGGEEEEEDT
jgi:hypothetical protein